MNAWMVVQGWAMVYRKYATDYVSQESAAKAARRGIWRDEFVEPSRWRRGERFEAAAASGAGDCRIKGNISRKGTRIYHVPGGACTPRRASTRRRASGGSVASVRRGRRGGGGRSGE